MISFSLWVVIDSLLWNKLWSPLLNSIFNIFGKNHRMLNFYYNITTIGVGIFQFHNKILNNLEFRIIITELFSTYYFFLVCCTIPNLLKIFKHVTSLPWRTNPKKHHHHGHFCIQMWSYEVQLLDFLQGQKTIFVNSNTNILHSCNSHHENFWNFFHIFTS